MTMPDEEIRAIQRAADFLVALAVGCDYYETKFNRVPQAVRDEARKILRHYPGHSSVARCWRRP